MERTSTLDDEGGKNREHEHPLNKCSLTDLFLSRGIKYNEDRRSSVILVEEHTVVWLSLDSHSTPTPGKTRPKRKENQRQVPRQLNRSAQSWRGILVKEAKRKTRERLQKHKEARDEETRKKSSRRRLITLILYGNTFLGNTFYCR